MSINSNKSKDKLEYWQAKLHDADDSFSAQRKQIDHQEELYQGRKTIDQICGADDIDESNVVWNIVYELIEAQVDSNIPGCKITPRRKNDKNLAVLIEDMLRNKIDETPSEVINDYMERAVPKHGGGAFLVEWDNFKNLPGREGCSVISFIHPKQLSPQPGITTDIEDMDWCGVTIPVTKKFVKHAYDIEIQDEEEENPERRGYGSVDNCKDLVSLHVFYYRNDNGGIGKFSFINDTVIEDMDDCLARRGRCCASCGRPEPDDINDSIEVLELPTLDGTYPGGGEWKPGADGILTSEAVNEVPTHKREKGVCPYCGGTKFTDKALDYEEVWGDGFDIYDDDGEVILHVDGEHYVEDTDADGNTTTELEPTKIPFYKPDIYPLILMKNISSYGKLLGESDIDKIEPQQNSINRLNQKCMDSLISNGSYITLPNDAVVPKNSAEGKEIRLRSIDQKDYFGVYSMDTPIGQTVSMMNFLYEQARNTIGITASFQGREDDTAESGAAKEISAKQAAGRFASKRTMKRYFWTRLYEALFKFELAYADDRRPVAGRDKDGMPKDQEWNRWRFLCKNEDTGEYYWNTDFLFSVDSSTELAMDRATMWREAYQYYSSGAYGDPAETSTRILFWQLMEELHYPNAAQIRNKLVEARASEKTLQAEKSVMELDALKEFDGRGGLPQ